jgi:uncharacterized DUF497 family protein
MSRFEWDPAKAESNVRKHGVFFEDAIYVFDDPLAFAQMDFTSHDEVRWRTIGTVHGHVLLVVVHTERFVAEGGHTVEVMRIISARQADAKERRRYEIEARDR